MSLEINEQRNVQSGSTKLSVAGSNNTMYNESSNIQDSLSLSFFSNLLKNYNIEYANTNINKSSPEVRFSLSFQTSKTESLSATGYLSEIENKLTADFSYQFEKIVEENGKSYRKTYSMNLNYEADIFLSSSVNHKIEKEDITSFIRRIVDDVMKLVNDDDKILTGIVLKGDDYADLIKYGGKKTSKMLQNLINIILMTAQIEEMTTKSKNAERVLYKPVREQKEFMEIKKSLVNNTHFNFSIKELSSKEI